MRALVLAASAAGLVLSACATSPAPKPPIAQTGARPTAKPPAHHTQPAPVETARPAPRQPDPEASGPPITLAKLNGWDEEDHLAGLKAFQDGCLASRDGALLAVCTKARGMRGASDAEAKRFFETHFYAVPIGDNGVLTAYFAPEYEARDRPDREFSAPVRPRPTRAVEAEAAAPAVVEPDLDDLIDVALQAGELESAQRERERPRGRAERIDLSRADRAAIERAAPDGALAWMKPEDLFFLQIQGSGTLTFPDGRRMKAAYATDNGKPFVAIARPMVQQGIFPANRASGDSIRSWLAANRGPRADAVMQLNPRYIFFDLSRDDGREPAGAAGIPLPAGRAIAIDPSRHPYGELYWIEAQAPVLSGAFKTYRRLAMALDTGSAIRGQVRADLYLGRGDAAGVEAGRVRHTLKMVRLRPIDLSRSARHEPDAEARGG